MLFVISVLIFLGSMFVYILLGNMIAQSWGSSLVSYVFIVGPCLNCPWVLASVLSQVFKSWYIYTIEFSLFIAIVFAVMSNWAAR